ncbi:putative serine esterase-domain-containing protein [Cantharellus anzutake]|uniref:putative serine esterase-domain-containing protein n=1 Tax=Cantharellus anzutake TaxID=1750568 RepID=UPI001906D459|nr:putative serine esterase-domain-containing protein [Cantharellus anzutake]KAF8323474.1 putative serine esterase-domain-containing protein [Cantharellus anzutake]
MATADDAAALNAKLEQAELLGASMTRRIHLLVLIHGLSSAIRLRVHALFDDYSGMWGTCEHLEELANTITEVHSNPPSRSGSRLDAGVELDVLVAQSNQSVQTYDGIDWGAERVVGEVIRERIQAIQSSGDTVIRFSITGYSLGGLVARYVVGVLHHADFFAAVEPVNFVTIATPHLGIPRYPTTVSSIHAVLGPKFLSRTGEQFWAMDKWDGPDGRPLLDIMNRRDSIFFKALSLFPHITIYANCINDTVVPYLTAAIETEDPFLAHSVNGIEVSKAILASRKLDERYSPIIESYRLPDVPPPPPPQTRLLSLAYIESLRRKIFVPSVLQARWPFNINRTTVRFQYGLVHGSVPVRTGSLRTVAPLLIARLSLDSRASRERIRLLEANTSRSDYLSSSLGRVEDAGGVSKQDNDAYAGLRRPAPMANGNAGARGFHLENPDEAQETNFQIEAISPRLTPLQLQMAMNLNSIPQLKKKLAYIDGVVNSHAVIISRDVKRFEVHKKGRGVVRNWAESFVL